NQRRRGSPMPAHAVCKSVAIALLTGWAMAAPAQAQTESVVLIQAGGLLDRPGQAPRGNATVIVRNGKVEAVRDGFIGAESHPGAQVIDLRERFVLPGLIDSHVHLDSDRAGQEGLLES